MTARKTTTTTATATPARRTRATAKAAANDPAKVPAVLQGVSAPAGTNKPANARTRTPKVTATTKTDGAASATVEVKAITKAEGKAALARLIIQAAGEAIESLAENHDGFGMAQEEMLRLAAQWLHYLPVKGVWPDGAVPVPNRSDWADKVSGLAASR